MKLTDDAIKENAINYIEHIKEPEQMKYLLAYINGEMKARDFYENQKCVACNNLLGTGFCNELTQFMPKTFGCTEWEPKK